MTYSLNEVEATARKAARGAGYAWGMADEAGKAVRWLCAHGIDGCGAMAGFLQQVDGRVPDDLTPDAEWTARGPFLCPITAGCTMADQGRLALAAEAVATPILLLPFLAITAQAHDVVLQLDCEAASAATDGQHLCVSGPFPQSGTVVVRIADGFGTPLQKATRADPQAADWVTLNAFAHRTYAPATEESRLKGAG